MIKIAKKISVGTCYENGRLVEKVLVNGKVRTEQIADDKEVI